MQSVLSQSEAAADPPPAAGPARLTIAISTLGSRLARIDAQALPAQAGWRYLILVQATGSAEPPVALAARPDIAWLTLDTTGVAASRNRALDAATTEYLLFSDDDIELLADGIGRLVAAFDARPDLAVLTAQTLNGDGTPLKAYARRARRLSLFNSAKTGTVEMMVRPARIRQQAVRFNTAFGVGTRLPLGDEYVFIADCLKAGLRGRYVPIPVAVHTARSSGNDWLSAESAEARARVFDTVFGPLSLPIKLLFLVRHWGEFRSVAQFLAYSRVMMRSAGRATAPSARK